MIGRILLFVLCLAGAVRATVDIDTFKTTSAVYDATIADTVNIIKSENYRNYGAATNLQLSEVANKQKRFLTRIDTDSLRARVTSGNMIKSARYYFRSAFAPPTCNISFYQVKAPWVEGSGNGADTSYMSEGISWMVANSPHKPDTTGGTLPTTINWADSGYVSAVKQQGSCPSCWDHAGIIAVESVHKKEVFTGSRSYNAEDGSGADRSVAPVATDTGSVRIITATGYKRFNIPPALITKMITTSGADCGFIVSCDSGDVDINTSENGSNKPIFNFTSRTHKNGLSFEGVVARIVGSSYMFDAQINSAAPTTNYETSTTADVNSTNKFLIRADSLAKQIKDALAATNDTLDEITAFSCSLYVVHTSTANLKIGKLYKKFIEAEVTWNVWKSTYEWGTAGANTLDELDLSEQQILNCLDGVDCNNGGNIGWCLQYLLSNGDSALSESQLPYISYAGFDNGVCPDNDTMANVTALGWYYQYRVTTERQLKQLVLMKPIAIAINWWSTMGAYVYNSSTDKCYYNSNARDGIHAVLLVGYDDNFTCDAGEGTGAWIIQNSWGTGWGESGLAHIAYGTWNGIVGLATGNNVPYVIDFANKPTYWTAPGLESSSDRSTTALTTVVTDGSSNVWYYADIPASLVQGWLNGNIPNYGVIAISDLTSGNFPFSTNSSENSSNQSYWLIESADAPTRIGNTSIGNTRIGQ